MPAKGETAGGSYYGYASLKALAKNAGFPDSLLDTMARIALAESGGNPSAHNGNAGTGDNSYGLWQINMIGPLGANRRAALRIASNDQLYDPATNARAAHYIYSTQGLNAWTTYKKELYKKVDITKATGKGAGIGTEEGAGLEPAKVSSPEEDPYSGISGAVRKFGDDVFKVGLNIQGTVIAVMLVGLGILLIFKTSKPAQALIKAVKP